jgi:EAL domain-containing protein (putative c-di-GMP-specific phosphodiesterase class I)
VPALVEEALVASGLKPERLELEITESVLLDAGSNVNGSIERLRDLQVRLALDDFGTGYSSLAYLRRIAFDKLKIDRSFVTDLPGEGAGLPIVHAIVSLAKALGMTVIAEGVENEAQQRCLVDLGCDECQGYLFGQAIPVEAATALVRPIGERHAALMMAG